MSKQAETMGTIRFELRADKIDQQGKAPVFLIYQKGIKQQGKNHRIRYNTGKKLFPSQWNGDTRQAVYLDKKAAKKLLPLLDYALFLSEKEVQAFNRELRDLSSHIEAIEKRFELDKIEPSAEMVVDRLKAEKAPQIAVQDTPSKFLFDFIDRYIADHKETREAGSLTVYKSLRTHLRDFQRHTRKQITFEKIDYAFFQSFQSFLITGAGTTTNRKGETVPRTPLNNTTVAKQLSTVKTFLNYARKQGVSVSDRFKDFKIKKESLEVIALTNEEFETLYYFDLTSNKRLEQVRDVFCFACTTGLRYSDLNQLKREHLKDDEIRLTVKKTKEHLTIPLSHYARAILKRYGAMHRPLPVISNQKLNDYIKELCEKAGINEPVEIVRFSGAKRTATTYPKYELIGVHTGRKTFATLSLERGMSAEEVMSITGHKDYQSFKRYVKVTEQRKKVVMLKAWGEAPNEVKLKRVI